MQIPKLKTKKIKRIDPYADLPKPVRKKIVRLVKLAKLQGKIPHSAQKTIPYLQMLRNGLCHVEGDYYTKTIEYNDINYRLAMRETKEAIFDGWCKFLNYFDSSVSVQLSFINQEIDTEQFYESIAIPEQGDTFDELREEYVTMLQDQLAKGNNSLVKRKFITFGIHAESEELAQMRLDRMESELIHNFKLIGCVSQQRNGYQRMEAIHDIFNIGTDRKLNFNWNLIVKTGFSTKDFIAPNCFGFQKKDTFELENRVGRVSYLQITAPKLEDNILSQFLDLDSPLIANIHFRSIDQVAALKKAKNDLADLNAMKAELQKKAFKNGTDIDMLPPDLVTYIDEAQSLIDNLESQNERMYLVTFTLTNFAENEAELENIYSSAKQIAQQHGCELIPLGWQQEAGLMSAVPIGVNRVDIHRMLPTSSTAIFVPFQTQELFQPGGLYYGVNAISSNMIMVDRLTANNPNGLILGTPGCFTGDTKVVLEDGTAVSFQELMQRNEPFQIKSYDTRTKLEVTGTARNVRITKHVKQLLRIVLEDGSAVQCTPEHRFLLPGGRFEEAQFLSIGQKLFPVHEVAGIEQITSEQEIPVYDLEVDDYSVFMLESGVYVHNSGKSFASKREITNVFLACRDDLLILDPEREYTPLVYAFGGQVIKISANSRHYINPMDINTEARSDEDSDFDPLKDKSDFILSFCRQICGSRESLEAAIEKSIIDRCLPHVYDLYFKDPKPENMPTLGNLYEMLQQQPEPEAKRIATGLELYVTGSLNLFNHRTNVEIDNRIVCFDIKDLPQHLKKLGMLVVQDQIWSRVRINRAMGKRTRYYADEFHLLLKDEQSAAASIEIWKRFRKWGGVPTGITQNVADFLMSPEIENIFSNSDFIYLLNQAPKDQRILANALNISEHQLSYVTNSQPGEGLLIFKGTIIPFIDHFPKETKLYSLMTTKLDEVTDKKMVAI